MNTRSPGRHFLQIPGPTDVPGRVLRAISEPTIDHRGPDFATLGRSVLTGLKRVFQTDGPVVIFPASGTGAWEAALVNTLSPGDSVLMARTGWFASLWSEMAKRLGLEPIFLETDWRRGADPAAIEAALRADKDGRIRAVCVVHNETSTGCVSPVAAVRRAIDAVGTSGAVAGRHDLVAGFDRLPARRVGRGRHRRREPEGADAPAGTVLQRRQRARVGSFQDGEAGPLLLGLAANDRCQFRVLFPLHSGHESPARLAGSPRDA